MEAPGRANVFALAEATTAIAQSVRREAERISNATDPTPEQLHRFHQRLRRLRVGLGTAGSVLSERQRIVAVEVDRRLRRLARLVGEVRDLDVAIAHLSDPRLLISGESSEDGLQATVHRLGEEARTGRALLGAFLRSEGDRGLFRDAEAIVRSAAPRLDGRSGRAEAAAALGRGRRRIERSLKRARRRPDRDRMHRLRLVLRRVHLLCDLLDASSAARAASFPDGLARLQRSLGALHDLDLLVDGARRLGDATASSPWLRRAEKRRRALRSELAEVLERKTTRKSVERLAL